MAHNEVINDVTINESFYDDGVLKRRVHLLVYLNGKPDARVDCYYKSGKLMSSWSCTDDKLDGLWECWHENGKIKCLEMFVKGIRNGVFEVYADDGKCILKDVYKDGES